MDEFPDVGKRHLKEKQAEKHLVNGTLYMHCASFAGHARPPYPLVSPAEDAIGRIGSDTRAPEQQFLESLTERVPLFKGAPKLEKASAHALRLRLAGRRLEHAQTAAAKNTPENRQHLLPKHRI